MTHEWPSPSPLHSLRRRGRKGEGRGTAKPFAKNVAALLLLLLLPLSSLFRPLSKSCFSALLRIRPFDRRRRRRMEAQWAEEEWGEIFGSPSLSLSTACVFQYPLSSSSPPSFRILNCLYTYHELRLRGLRFEGDMIFFYAQVSFVRRRRKGKRVHFSLNFPFLTRTHQTDQEVMNVIFLFFVFPEEKMETACTLFFFSFRNFLSSIEHLTS